MSDPSLTETATARQTSIGSSNRERRRLYTFDELLGLPPIEWLVEGVIPRHSFGILFGKPGEGKTFLALDLAVSIATGQAWAARRVRRGPVVYVAAEGWYGLRDRAGVLRADYGDGEIPVRFVLRDLQLAGDLSDVRWLCDELGDSPGPELIILDTVSRCIVGVDENSTKEMGLFVATVSELQAKTGACVLGLHHTTKKGDVERGSSVLRGAVDFMMRVEKTANVLDLSSTKQKDAEPFEPMRFRLLPVEGRVGTATFASCVLSLLTGQAARDAGALPQLSPSATKVLRALGAMGRVTPPTELRLVANNGGAMAETSFRRAQGDLLGLGLIEWVQADLKVTEAGGRWLSVPGSAT